MYIKRYFITILLLSSFLTYEAYANLQSRQVIIVPPNEIFLSGYETLINLCKTCKNKNFDKKENWRKCKEVCEKGRLYQDYAKLNQNVLLFSDLGKLIYQNMIEGITLFNRKCAEKNKKFKYILNTNQQIPIANYKSNDNIGSFYANVKSNNDQLSRLLKKKNSDVFLWIEYTPEFKTAISDCISATSCENQNLKATLVLFDGWKKKTSDIVLKFKKGYLTFSIKSIIELKIAVANLLFDNKFPETLETEKSKSTDSHNDDKKSGNNQSRNSP